MFGIFDKKGRSVVQPVNTALKSLSQKHSDKWFVTPTFGPKQLPTLQDPVDRLCVVSSEKPLFENPAVLHDGRVFSDEKIVASVLQKATDAGEKFSEIVETVDGEFAVALTNGKEIFAARDILGRKPLFYDENDDIAAFCCQKKPLWQIGLCNVKPLRAGQFIQISDSGASMHTITPLREKIGPALNENLDNIIEIYSRLLHNAISKRYHKDKKIGALLSGGVDSTLLAKLVYDLAQKKGMNITIYTAGTPDAVDVTYAKRFTKECGLPHKVRILELADVESYIPKVIRAVEERDFVQVEAGIGVYAAEEMAAQDGVEILFSGQGPDELWGGYEWYPAVVGKEGYEGFVARCWSDLERADIETLDRENKIAMAHGITSVFPYIDTEIVKLAMSTSPRLKISSETDTMGKRPHRALAAKLGLPSDFADRKKDAAQHGTGIHDLLDKIAQKRGYNQQLMERINYNSEAISDEILSSSGRYGYLYADKKAWLIGKHIQFLFDTIAFKEGLLNAPERENIEGYMKKM